MMLQRIRVVFAKEVSDNMRDRRALSSALLYPLIGPVLIVLMMTMMGRQISEQRESVLQLPVVGGENAPALIEFLEQQGVEIQDPPDDPEAAVKAGDLDVVLVIPDDYAELFGAGRSASVQVVVDESRTASDVPVSRTKRMLERYSGQIAALRLIARGVSPEVVRPMQVQTLDVATPQSQAASFLGLMPYFLIFSVFIGGMYLAIDSTAGERERGSLEPLLMNPVARGELVIGKLSAVMVFTFIAVGLTVAAFGVVLNVIPSEELLGAQMSLSVWALLAVLAIVLPIMPLAASLQIIVASFARSFKEAQNYLSLMPLLPALPGLFLMFMPAKPQLWTMLVPTFSQQLLIIQIMRGEAVRPEYIALSIVATLLAAGVAVAVAIRLYQGERIIFGRGG
jgi:sodium transport system permease protein